MLDSCCSVSRLCRVIALVLLVLVPAASPAQNYPDKPIRIVVPSAPGGGADPAARRLAAALAPLVGQQVNVDNRPGGAGVIAAQELARSAPDGHTLLYATNSDVLREFTPNAAYAWNRFVPVTRLWSSGYVIVVHPSVPADSLPKLIALAKAKPGSLSYASSGPGGGSSLFGARLKHETRIDMVEVPYKSQGAGLPDLLSGRVQVAFEFIHTVGTHLKSGKLKALAVSHVQRLSVLPDVPTVGESGSPDLVTSVNSYILVPAGTPQPIVQRLHQHLARAIQPPDFKAQAVPLGLEVAGDSPAETAALLRAESDRWGRLIKSAGLKIE